MPMYEFHCDHCGGFSALRKMSESQAPAVCEECGALSPRVMSAPRLALMGKAARNAHERNEKSAHEPAIRRRSSCGCTGTHTCKSSSPDKKPGLQMQTKKSARPWMLGH